MSGGGISPLAPVEHRQTGDPGVAQPGRSADVQILLREQARLVGGQGQALRALRARRTLGTQPALVQIGDGVPVHQTLRFVQLGLILVQVEPVRRFRGGQIVGVHQEADLRLRLSAQSVTVPQGGEHVLILS